LYIFSMGYEPATEINWIELKTHRQWFFDNIVRKLLWTNWAKIHITRLGQKAAKDWWRHLHACEVVCVVSIAPPKSDKLQTSGIVARNC